MTAFFMAWMMFCRIPCPSCKWDDRLKQEMIVWFPVIGLIIGAVNFAAYQLFAFLDMRFLGAAVLCFIPWILSGFIHLDGFADCADARLSCRDEKKTLEILKDSHVGAFAVISVVILAFLSFAAWSQCVFSINAFTVILIPAASRTAAGICVLSCRPLSVSSYEKMHSEGIRRRNIILLIIILAAVLTASVLLCGLQGIAAAVAAGCGFLTVLRLKKKLGGMSGDVAGCAVCIAELTGVIALCFL